VLIYEEDCNILPLGEIIKGLFNCLRIRFYNKYSLSRMGACKVRGCDTCVDDEEVLLLVLGDVPNSSQQQSCHRILGTVG
jgi:hypothetical protein